MSTNLKPETSVMVGLGVAAGVAAIYSNALPTIADLRVGQQGDRDAASAERGAAWAAAALVVGISAITGDYTVLTIGGGTWLFMTWLHKHANEVDPRTGKASMSGGEPDMYAPDADDMPEAA